MFDSIKTLRNSQYVWVLLVISLGWLASLGIRIIYPVLLPDIVEEYAIQYTEAGITLSILWIAYAAVQFPAGILADRIGEQRVIIASLGLSVFAIVGIVVAPTYLIFLFATAILGVGTGLFGPSRVTVLSDVFPEQRNAAVSFSQAVGNTGNAILPIIAGIIAAALGWRYGLGFLLPVFSLVVVGAIVHIPTRTSAGIKNQLGIDFFRRLNGALMRRDVILAALILFSLLFYYQGMTGFLPTYLGDNKNISQSIVAGLYGSFFVTAIVLQFIGGIAADRYGEERTIIVFIIVGAIGTILLAFVENTLLIVTTVLLSASTLGAIPSANTKLVTQLPESVQGSGFGLLRTLYIGFGAAAPPFVGYLADVGLFDVGIIMLAAVALCGIIGCYNP